MNNAVFGKTTENVRKHRDKKLITTERRRKYLVSELTGPTCSSNLKAYSYLKDSNDEGKKIKRCKQVCCKKKI